MIMTIIKGLLFSAFLIYAAITDIKKREIENIVPIAIIIISLIGTGGSFWGAVLTALPFFVPALLKSDSIGGGDIKLMFACGAVLGVWGGILQIIIGLAIATIHGLCILVTKGYKAYKSAKIPLAPFLCVGGILSFAVMDWV